MVRSEAASRATRWTRHRPPSRQEGFIDRPRVVELLARTIAAERVAVVCAPSGYGKTSAVGAWAAQHAVAWLSLDAFDSDPARLAAGIIEALQAGGTAAGMAGSGELAALDAMQRDVGTTYRQLCDALAAMDQPLTLVIDDAHRAAEAIDGGLLGALIEEAPEQLRIVLVGTALLAVVLSRYLLMHPAALIDAATLAFDADEVAAVMAAQTAVTPEVVMAETQGWPIAVRVMALGGARPQPQGAVSQETIVRDYVRDHVLRSLPPDVVRVVFDTSVAQELTPGLAAALTDRSDAAALLEKCARLGLFIDRFATDDGIVYRWHAHFARQCRAILRLEDPGRFAVLHRRAASALADAAPLAAITHLVAADALDEAKELICRCWVGLVLGSDAGALDRLCATLPAPHSGDPRVLYIRACAQDLIGEHEAARIMHAEAEAVAAGASVDSSVVRALAGLFLFDTRAAVAQADARVREIAAQGGAAFAQDRAAVLYLLAWANMRVRSDVRLIVDLLTAALREAESTGRDDLALRARHHLALTFSWAGALTRARQALAEGADHAGGTDDAAAPWQYFAGGSAALSAGLIAYWAGETAEADRHLSRVVRSGSGMMSFAGIAVFLLALNAAASRDAAACRRAAQELQALPRTEMHGWSWPAFRGTGFAVLEEAAGRRDRALALAGRIDARRLPMVAVTLAGIHRRAGDPAAALRLLQAVDDYEDVSYVRIATLITAAVVHRRRGAMELTHELCERVLDGAVAEGIRRPFCENELELRQLLTEHIAWGTRHEDFIADCLTDRTGGGPLDALSDRERDVFEQLHTTRTVAEIAAQLGVSVNTVKTHQRAVYRKLGVASRRAAVRLST